MRWIISLLVVMLAVLQYRLWVGEGSLAEAWTLHQQVEVQHDENARLAERNLALEAEVVDLRTGLDALEERARSELGMISGDEVFYHVVEEPDVSQSRALPSTSSPDRR